MATYYLDYENGSDSNDGSSWANAWKSVEANSPSSGDTIKIAKSRDPFSIGDVTWTNGSNVLTLSSSSEVYVLEDGSGTWTNVALTTTPTSSTTYYLGTNSIVFTIPTTPPSSSLLAYKNLGSAIDLSAYQELCFMFGLGDAYYYPGDFLVLNLCSDTSGQTVVDSIKIPALHAGITYGRLKVSVKKTGGGNLGSSIQSIALYCDQSYSSGSTVGFWLDEVYACKTDGIKLTSLLSKQSSKSNFELYPIEYISGSSVYIAQNQTNTTLTRPTYYGTTETVTTYARDPIFVLNNSDGAIDSVEVDNLFFEGGWDTSTDEQDSITFFCLPSYFLGVSDGIRSVSFNLIGVTNGYRLLTFDGSSADTMVTLGNFGFYSSSTLLYFLVGIIKNLTVVGAEYPLTGVRIEAGVISLFSCYSVFSYYPTLYIDTLNVYSITNSIISQSNYVDFLYIRELNTYNCSLSQENTFYTVIKPTFNFSPSNVPRLGENSNGYSEIWKPQYNIKGQAATAGGSGTEWVINVTSSDCKQTDFLLAKLLIGTVLVEASKEVTVKVYIKKSSATGIGAKIYIPAFQVGLTEPEEQIAPSDTTRNQVTLQFTPTRTGVVKIFVAAWYISSTTDNVIVDDIEVSQ